MGIEPRHEPFSLPYRQDWQLYGQAMLEQRLREVAVWDEWDFAYLRHCLSSDYAARVRAREEEGRERERAAGELRLLQTIQVRCFIVSLRPSFCHLQYEKLGVAIFFYTVRKKSCGVEPGNEASLS